MVEQIQFPSSFPKSLESRSIVQYRYSSILDASLIVYVVIVTPSPRGIQSTNETQEFGSRFLEVP